MKTNFRFCFVIILPLILLISQVSAITPKTGTIVLKDGTRYENVPYKVDNQFKVVKFEQDDEKINISFTDISQIFNSDGVDVTAQIMGRPSPRQQETWKASDDDTYVKARKKLWHASLELNGNFSFPLSDYYEGAKSGIGFGGQFTVAFTERLAGMVIFSKSGADFDDKYSYFYLIDPNYTIIDENVDLRILRYFVAVQYYNRPDRITPGKSIFYFYTGLGAVSEKLIGEISVRDETTGFVETLNDSSSDSYFAMTFGGGTIQMLNKNIGIDLGGSFDMLAIGKIPGTSQIQYAYLFDFKAGLVFFFGEDK